MEARRHRLCALASLVAGAATACRHQPADALVSYAELTAAPVAPATARIAYGPGARQFGDLRLPNGHGPFPIVVLVHGGCWQAGYGLDYVAPAAAALTRLGVATWSIEYRRLGDPGGGWPGTFEDVARATSYVTQLAERFPLDPRHVVLAGHSAGGQLALWVAQRERRAIGDAPALPAAITIRGVIGLAGITDLRAYSADPGSCNLSVAELLDGMPAERPDRYAAASPIERLPLGVPSRMVHGASDPIVSVDQSRTFAERAKSAGDDAGLVVVPGAGHFDLVAPRSAAWPAVVDAVRGLLPR